MHNQRVDLSFKLFNDLMRNKVHEILLVSSPYDAFIMEEDGRLAERIINEYRGLNLSRPPSLTLVSSAKEALSTLQSKKFDLVIMMPRIGDMEPDILGAKIKEARPDLSVFMLSHDVQSLEVARGLKNHYIDNDFVWLGNTDLLLAIIKMTEDRLNVSYDTENGDVRVIVLVEDSPLDLSSVLPVLYKEIVSQTQRIIEESINSAHRLLKMRARPKILVARNFETAIDLCRQFSKYLLSVFSDVSFPKDGQLNKNAGFELLAEITKYMPDLPVLSFSSEETNRYKAKSIGAEFLNKTSETLHKDIRSFLQRNLGFGDFIFTNDSGKELGRASNIKEMQDMLEKIEEESIYYHASSDHFSRWFMARSELILASKLKRVKAKNFKDRSKIRTYLIKAVKIRRMARQKGIVTDFAMCKLDHVPDFSKIGKGSLGGKARGLAFISTLLKERRPLFLKEFPKVNIFVPKTLVISTEVFQQFIIENQLKELASDDFEDRQVYERFDRARLPESLISDLRNYLAVSDFPLAIRSSSLLEDAHFQPFAGIYKTCMFPNNSTDIDTRLKQLISAIKIVLASTYTAHPKAYAKSTLHRIEEEEMAVIIQQLTGSSYGGFFYPAFSGSGQSYNFYPISYMKQEEGIAYIAMGLGKTVMEGETSLRFSPRYPEILPHFSTPHDILKNAQKCFYALKMDGCNNNRVSDEDCFLTKLKVAKCADHPAVKMLASSYSFEDDRIRDTFAPGSDPVITFASILKYETIPIAKIISNLLDIGTHGMGCPVEIEFAVNPFTSKAIQFALLQVRPMSFRNRGLNIEINQQDIENAFCYSDMAMGNGIIEDIKDIMFIKQERFAPDTTFKIASIIGDFNAKMSSEGKKYLLAGPGRWGSTDRSLGIPVGWKDISQAKAIIETQIENINIEPSFGSHFFHNITSLGIGYITLVAKGKHFLNNDILDSMPVKEENEYFKHLSLEKPILIKIDGKKSKAVVCY